MARYEVYRAGETKIDKLPIRLRLRADSGGAVLAAVNEDGQSIWTLLRLTAEGRLRRAQSIGPTWAHDHGLDIDANGRINLEGGS